MNTVDYIFITVVVLFSVGALVNLWYLANRRRNRSIQDYLDCKEKRTSKFTNE
jgi:hypothetical protein